jgi:tetratricopeptide (TPR) repeat protein
MGRLAFETDARGRVVGRFSDGPCKFDPQRPVVDGEFEGDVLVGAVTLCQTGPACEERTYPILAFRLSDGSLSAQVKLEPACQSAALDGTRLVLRPVPDQATALASVNEPPKLTNAECSAALLKGNALYEKHDWAGVSFYFKKGLACNEAIWQAHLAIGNAELRRGNVEAALVSYNRAREISIAQEQENDGIYYNIACVYSQIGDQAKALEALRRALDLGWSDPTAMERDADLKPLRELPAFKELVDRAWEHQERLPSKDEHP